MFNDSVVVIVIVIVVVVVVVVVVPFCDVVRRMNSISWMSSVSHSKTLSCAGENLTVPQSISPVTRISQTLELYHQ